MRPTETYYIPNQRKFNEDSDELLRFEKAALCGGENPSLLRPLFKHFPLYHD